MSLPLRNVLFLNSWIVWLSREFAVLKEEEEQGDAEEQRLTWPPPLTNFGREFLSFLRV